MADPLGRLAASDGRPAVVEPGRGAVSYADLDRLADRVAARLAGLGVARDSRVGLYLNRSADAIAAMLGCLRAGCAYVPVDPSAPALRNAEILAACGVRTALVEAPFVEAFRSAWQTRAEDGDVQALSAVGAGRAIADWAPAAEAPPAREPSELACVLYTSGSTGRHKGWLMTREAIEAHARWSRNLIRPGPDDVFANHAPFSFGMSLFDIYASLTSGASLVLVPENIRQFPEHVVDFISRERVSIWFSGPAILSLIADSEGLEERDLRALRHVAFAGEVFPAASLRKLRRRLPHPRYFNFYGSTETNVAAFHELAPDSEVKAPPPIGRPCTHYEARVVDSEGRLVPPGAVGELQLRGAGLASGYLDQPELTAERIVAAQDGGLPWYRTCDLVSELPNGDLQYAGRLGRMVKLRGYRVEPGEIELRLNEHPEVSVAAVVPAEGPRGLRLVAHLCSPRLPVIELKRFCAERLPAYMVPEQFVFHRSLPRNARGK
ncbi:MAG: amino acid adenylation domain-containing protein, partial [Myxococcota bacterium]